MFVANVSVLDVVVLLVKDKEFATRNQTEQRYLHLLLSRAGFCTYHHTCTHVKMLIICHRLLLHVGERVVCQVPS